MPGTADLLDLTESNLVIDGFAHKPLEIRNDPRRYITSLAVLRALSWLLSGRKRDVCCCVVAQHLQRRPSVTLLKGPKIRTHVLAGWQLHYMCSKF